MTTVRMDSSIRGVAARRRGVPLVLALCLLALPGCRREAEKRGPPEVRAVPVTAALVERKAVDLSVHAIGTVEPIRAVSVRSQVSGMLTKIAFGEGDEVKEGQLLFEIDPRSFEADLKRAEATLARDQALLTNADRQAKRYEELVQKDFVTQSQWEEVRTSAEVLKATVKADAESVATARLQLEYATIRSPLTGRTGNLQVHAGDLIKANDVPLVIVNQIKPILVRFSVPAERLPEVQKYSAATNLTVRVLTSREAAGQTFEGTLCFVDNAVNGETGSILLKARFENRESVLWPGQYVDVVLVLKTDPDALTVPSQAVQPSQDGLIVFVVKSDMTVEKRTVEVERTVDGTSVVAKGLTAGEQVVTDGQLRLMPGSKVEIRAGLKGAGAGK